MQLHRVCLARAEVSEQTPAHILEERVDQRKERHDHRQDIDIAGLLSSLKSVREHIRLYKAVGKNIGVSTCVHVCNFNLSKLYMYFAANIIAML